MLVEGAALLLVPGVDEPAALDDPGPKLWLGTLTLLVGGTLTVVGIVGDVVARVVEVRRLLVSDTVAVSVSVSVSVRESDEIIETVGIGRDTTLGVLGAWSTRSASR